MQKELIVEALAKRVESGEITIEQIHEFYRDDVRTKLAVVAENT